MNPIKDRMKRPGGKREELTARWAALFDAVDENVPEDITEEEIEREIAQAIEQSRLERRARAGCA